MEKVIEMSRVTLPDGEEFDLEYFLVSEEAPKERARAYGIGVQKLLKQAPAENRADFPEREVVEKVTESEEKAVNWIEILARNQVTPVGLVAVLDDLITQEGV